MNNPKFEWDEKWAKFLINSKYYPPPPIQALLSD